MAIAIEDGTIVAGANSYITTAELDSYLNDRGYSIEEGQEAFLIRAFDMIAGLNLNFDASSPYTVTQNLKNGQAEIAYRISLGVNPSGTPKSGSVKREKVDSLEIEYFSSKAPSISSDDFIKQMPQAYSLLKGFLVSKPVYLGRA